MAHWSLKSEGGEKHHHHVEGLWHAGSRGTWPTVLPADPFGKQVGMGGAGQDSRVGSQSDLHKSVHQFGIDCFAQQNQPTSIRFRVRQTVYLGKVSKWINFSILGELVFRCWSRGSARAAACWWWTTVVVLVSCGGRRYCCASRHSQIDLFLFIVNW